MAPMIVMIQGTPFELTINSTRNGEETLFQKSKVILSNPMQWCISLGNAAQVGVVQGLATFGPTFIVGLGIESNPKMASLIFGSIVAVMGGMATVMGGSLADKCKDWSTSSLPLREVSLWIMSTSTALGLVFAALMSQTRDANTFWILLSFTSLLLFIPNGGASVATLQSVPKRLRALTIAIQTLIIHCLGDVPSPIIIGYVKDELAPRCNAKLKHGEYMLDPECYKDEEGLRYTLAICLMATAAATSLWGVALYLHYREEKFRRTKEIGGGEYKSARESIASELGESNVSAA